MAIDQNLIMQHLMPRQNSPLRGACSFAYVRYQLANLILGQKQFSDIQALIDFCSEPENLREWLPSASDRCVIAADLAASLRNARPSAYS